MKRIGWTIDPIVTANTNRDGSGTVYRVLRIEDENGQFVDNVNVESLGSNVATQFLLLGSNGGGVETPSNNFVMASVGLAQTVAGTHASTDTETIAIRAWLPHGYEIYGVTYAAQASGRQCVAYSDSTYQQRYFSYTAE